MGKKIIGIICIIAALVSAVTGFSAKSDAPAHAELVKNAPYITDGVIHPENEGKIVVVTGTLDADLPFADSKTGVKLSSIVTFRHVEKLSMKGTDKDEKPYWKWDPTMAEADFGGTKKLIAPGVTLGEYAVAEDFLMAIPAAHPRTEYDKKEVNQLNLSLAEDQGKVYLQTQDKLPRDEEDVTTIWLDPDFKSSEVDKAYKHAKQTYDGLCRVTYAEISPEDTLEYTIIGRQENGKLVEPEELDMTCILSGHRTTEELLAHVEESASGAMAGSLIMAAVLLAVGVLMIVKDLKKKA